MGFERLALVDHEPVALFSSFVSLQVVPGLVIDERHRGSLYQALEDCGVVLTHAEMAAEVTPCSTRQSGLLGLLPGAPLLHVEGTSFDEKAAPVEYFKVFYRGDRIRLRLDAHRTAEEIVGLAARASGRGRRGNQDSARR